MITRAHIRNFRCLADVNIEFEPLTILVGPNASGKSAIIAALQPGPSDGRDARYGQGSFDVRLIRDDGGMMARDGGQYGCQILHLDLDRIRAPNQVREERVLNVDGGNLTNLFATLT